MPITSDDIRRSLLAHDGEYRRLAEEHTRCATELEELVRQPYLSSEDLTQEVTLKKMKLHLKDRMELMVAQRFHEQQNGRQREDHHEQRHLSIHQ
jgi:uncharacterized protein